MKVNQTDLMDIVGIKQTFFKNRCGTWKSFLNNIDKNILDLNSKENCIKDYQRVKTKIKKIPSARDLEQYGNIQRFWYEKHWNSWLSFKRVMGDNKQQYSKEEIIIRFKKAIKELDKFPSVRDIRKYNKSKNRDDKLISDNTIRDLFGSYSILRKEMGYEGKWTKCCNLTKKDIIKDFLDIKKKLNRVPWIDQDLKKKDHFDYNFFYALQTKLKIDYFTFLKRLNLLDEYKQQRKESYRLMGLNQRRKKK